MSDLEKFKELLGEFELSCEEFLGEGGSWVLPNNYQDQSNPTFWVFTAKGAFKELTTK